MASVHWPAALQVTVTLTPEELFQPCATQSPRIVFSGETGFRFDGISGKVSTTSDRYLPALMLDRTFDSATLQMRGNKATLCMEAHDEKTIAAAVDFLCINVAQFISVHVGIFVDVASVNGLVGDVPFSALYPSGSYSLLWVNLTDERRTDAINKALKFPQPASVSYNRFVVASFYYQHALRILSPHEASYAPYLVHAEVMLNLVKSIEILFGSLQRDELRTCFASLGYTQGQIESQLIPILIMRSETDVAHPTASRAPQDILATYREYIDRSVVNVGAVFTRTAEKIEFHDDFLKPLPVAGSADREGFVEKLRGYLHDAPLSEPTRSTCILQTK